MEVALPDPGITIISVGDGWQRIGMSYQSVGSMIVCERVPFLCYDKQRVPRGVGSRQALVEFAHLDAAVCAGWLMDCLSMDSGLFLLNIVIYLY